MIDRDFLKWRLSWINHLNNVLDTDHSLLLQDTAFKLSLNYNVVLSDHTQWKVTWFIIKLYLNILLQVVYQQSETIFGSNHIARLDQHVNCVKCEYRAWMLSLYLDKIIKVRLFLTTSIKLLTCINFYI